jgi:hypothetical protein
MATAVLPGFNLDKIVFNEEAQLLPPGHLVAQICQKIFRAWLYHPRPPEF